jgi:hypothetical protein
VTYTTDRPRAPKITTYPQRGRDGKDLRVIRGPIEQATAVKNAQLQTTPGAFVRYETIDRGLDMAYFEIELPLEGPPA